MEILRDGFVQDILYTFKKAKIDGTDKQHKVICYTNLQCEAYNHKIRSTVYGATSTQPMIGESLMAHGAIFEGKNCIVKNNEIVTVSKVRASTRNDLEGYEIRTIEYPKNILFVPVSVSAMTNSLGRLVSRAKMAKGSSDRRGAWYKWKVAKNSIADLRPCFAITAHRAQGATFSGKVYIDTKDIAKANEDTMARLTYVAMTRARSTVVLSGSIASGDPTMVSAGF